MRLIDADALMNNIRRAVYTSDLATTIAVGICENHVKDMQTVDAVPVVHGRWIKMVGMMPPEYHGHYECSECQWHMKGLRNSWTREEELSYCPNCGAKMDGGNKDDE